MTTYVRVVEAGSLSAAAKQLRISAAAVSRQIATLEAELDTALLARTTRRMTVTTEGQAYYERCLRILHDVVAAQAVGRGAIAGALKISVPVTFGLASVAAHLRALAIAQPDLQLDLRLEDQLIDLVLEGIDIAIRVASTPPLSTEIIAQRLTEWQRVIVASPGYLKQRGEPRTPEALAKHDALSHALDAGAALWNLVDGERTARVRVNVRCASNSGHILRDLAVDGAGIAMMPPWFVKADVARHRLRIILPAWRSEPLVVHALYRTSHRNDPRVRLVVEKLRAAYA